MVEHSDEPSLLDRTRSSARIANASYNPYGAGDQRPAQPLRNTSARSDAGVSARPTVSGHPSSNSTATAGTTGDHVAEKTASSLPPPAPPPLDTGDGEAPSSIGKEKEEKQNIIRRFYEACKEIMFASWINVLLVFVPVGIAVQAAGVNKTIIFAINAIAIIPLAGLLSHATESVASDLGDTIGALMNITFGNAVELIIL
jgi:Ca2+:H+ antiporter